MLTYVLRRLLAAVPTLWGVATAVFIMARLLPGDPARVIAGLLATPEQVEALRRELGLDQPLPVQYLDYLGRLLHFDLGTSAHFGTPVTAEIGSRLPYTIELALVAAVVASVLGVLAGVAAALRRNSPLDLAVSAVSVLGISMPAYWLGLMLIAVFAVQLRVLPAAGADSPAGVVLPAVTLALLSVGLVARMTRSSLLEVLGQDYVRTARAKGAAPWRVVMLHALRNALVPILTAMGLQLGALMGGAVLTESVFGWPGVGRLLLDSIFFRDYPMVQGLVLLFAVTYIAINLVVDLLYLAADPRVRYD
ncbi:MAG TPA: ABC transporter permease [Candidatus Dormibacteraeota bacterium]|nr:ABC transporter permease [Candidatus Dormibacteraeota bacterium]